VRFLTEAPVNLTVCRKVCQETCTVLKNQNEYFFNLLGKQCAFLVELRSPVLMDTDVSLHSRPVFFINSIWGLLFNQNDMTSLSIQFTAQIGYFNFDRDKEASQTIEVINAKPNDFQKG